MAAHKAEIRKGKRRCKKCGKLHSFSEHWSHEHGPHRGAHGEKAWYGRKKRPQGKRKIRKPAKKKGRRRAFTRGGTTFGPIRTTRTRRLPRRTAAERLAMGRAARAAARPKKRKAKRSAAQKAATARMLAAAAARRGGGGGRKKARKVVRRSGGGRKKPRSAAQKAATARMLAAAAAKRGKRGMRVKRSSSSPRPIPMHLVRGHLASNPGRSPGKHRVAAHLAADPGTLSAADRAHNRRLARKFNRKSKSKFG